MSAAPEPSSDIAHTEGTLTQRGAPPTRPTLDVVDHDELLPTGPALDRQHRSGARDAKGRRLAPSRVPETHPTPLQDVFIYLSLVVLVCGVVAISALELGATLGDPLVRLPILVGGAILALVTSDALLRVWRSAFAWLPVDRARGLFRFLWAAVLAASLVALVAGAWLVLRA